LHIIVCQAWGVSGIVGGPLLLGLSAADSVGGVLPKCTVGIGFSSA
jgi:hypothetical protein